MTTYVRSVPVVIVLALVATGVADAQTFRSGGTLPDVNWVSPLDSSLRDIPIGAARQVLDRAGWQRARPLPGNEIELIIEVAFSDELGGVVGQRIITEGVVGENEIVVDGGIDGPYLVAVQYEPVPAYQAIRLSGNLELDVVLAGQLYQNVQPSYELSDEALRAEVLKQYAVAAENDKKSSSFRESLDVEPVVTPSEIEQPIFRGLKRTCC